MQVVLVVCIAIGNTCFRGDHYKFIPDLRGVPTEQRFYSMGPLIGIETNNLKPSHSGNTYPLRSLLISM